MGEAKVPSGRFSWCTSGIVALAAHILLLWSVPSAPLETQVAFEAATTMEWESSQAQALAGPANQPAGASAAPRLDRDPAATTRPAAQSRRSRGSASADAPLSSRTGESHARVAKLERDAARTTGEDAPQEQVSERKLADAARTSGGDAPREQASERTVAAAARAQTSEATRRQDADPAARQASADERSGGAAGTQFAAAGATSHAPGVHGQGPGALMRGPRLIAAHDPCAGFFPGTAEAKRGQVQLSVDVDAQGHPRPTQTLLELPRGQGFENAAKACAAHLHFAPALDAQGRPVSARARIALRFERS